MAAVQQRNEREFNRMKNKKNTKSGLSVKSFVKAGGITGTNHNRAACSKGIKVKSFVKAGGITGTNHNRALAR
jgi:phosphoribosylanthranilate isomerase